MDRDVETEAMQFSAAGSDPLVARVILSPLLTRYGRERVRGELMKQAILVGVISIAAAPNWQRPKKSFKAGATA
jgi:hypothetical protein